MKHNGHQRSINNTDTHTYQGGMNKTAMQISIQLYGIVSILLRSLQGLTWSVDSVLRDSVKQAEVLGLKVAPLESLPVLQDIDVLQACANPSYVMKGTSWI
jgi:D-mannonate dehydratase